MPSRTKSFHHPLLKELQATESSLGLQYSRLRRARNPQRAAILQFVKKLVRLQLRLDGLNQTLNAMGQIASAS
jgi:hypothetical protein